MTFPHFLNPCLLHLIVLFQLARKDDLLPEASQLFPTVLGTAKLGGGGYSGFAGAQICLLRSYLHQGQPLRPGLTQGKGCARLGRTASRQGLASASPSPPPTSTLHPGASRPPLPPPGHPARLPYPARGRRGCRTTREPAARGPRSCAPPCRSC